MNINDIKELVKFIKSNKIGEFSYKKGDEEITIKLWHDGQVIPSVRFKPDFNRQKEEYIAGVSGMEQAKLNRLSLKTIETENIKGNLKEIISPFVGTFYRSPAPDKPPFVEVNSIVEKNSPVCIVEAMKLMNEIEVDIKCRIVSILAENGQIVEFGQPLLIIEPF